MDICKNRAESSGEMNIVIVGHVDHGKSTVIGRLLADTSSLPQGKLEQIREMCRRNSKPFEYAFLLDALKDERSQGITIDTARCFFKTEKRRYIIIDAPGHIEFLKNMITGASRAEAALLVIDALEGIRENSRRHGYMLSMLGIKQVAVLVNKMDLVGYDKSVFDGIVSEYGEFLKKIDVHPDCYIPVSASMGDNIASASEKMPWYGGETVLTALDAFRSSGPAEGLPFRMPVQDVYKFTAQGDSRRIIAGTVESGEIRAGDEVCFYPSGKKTKIKTIETFNAPVSEAARAGFAAGFTIEEQIYIRRGELMAICEQKEPVVSEHIQVNLFWLGKEPMTTDRMYFLKIGTSKVRMRLREIVGVMDASTLGGSQKDRVERHDVAECILETERPVAFDPAYFLPSTGRFVIVDRYEISGGGIIMRAARESETGTGGFKKSTVTAQEREHRYGQKAALVAINGGESVAAELEKILFSQGRHVYFPGEPAALRGSDSLYHLLENGAIVIIHFSEKDKRDVEALEDTLGNHRVFRVHTGKDENTEYDLEICPQDPAITSAEKINKALQTAKIIL